MEIRDYIVLYLILIRLCAFQGEWEDGLSVRRCRLQRGLMCGIWVDSGWASKSGFYLVMHAMLWTDGWTVGGRVCGQVPVLVLVLKYNFIST